MDGSQLMDRIIASYSVYYDVQRHPEEEPFVATAVFSEKQEQYFLTRSARLSETETNEFVYFADHTGAFTASRMEQLAALAWESGLRKVVPCHGHRSSDVILIIAADSVDPDAVSSLKRLSRSRSYKLGFYGFSLLKLAVIDKSDNRVYSNRCAHDLKKQVEKIIG